MQKNRLGKLFLAGAIAGLLAHFESGCRIRQLSVITSDRTQVKDGDTIEPIGFQGVQLITSRIPGNHHQQSRKAVTINSIKIEGDPDFTVNSADSGLNLWEKKPLVINNQPWMRGSLSIFTSVIALYPAVTEKLWLQSRMIPVKPSDSPLRAGAGRNNSSSFPMAPRSCTGFGADSTKTRMNGRRNGCGQGG